MESQPQNPEFSNNPENFHQCFWPVRQNWDSVGIQVNCVLGQSVENWDSFGIQVKLTYSS